MLAQHFDLLLRWNRKMNLTAITDPEEIVERHYCESLFLASHLPGGPLSIVDVGSGPGFPGVPVAVYRPDCRVFLVESRQRKAVFLRESARRITNIEVIARRAETIEVTFDWLVSRAVKWPEVGVLVPRLASNVAVLAGIQYLDEYCSAGVRWHSPVKIPWGDKRGLLIGLVPRCWKK